MRKRSRYDHCFVQRVAEGEIAAEYMILNGLSRANGNGKCPEYGRRSRFFVNKISI